jgi:adenylate kinase
MRIVLLGPPGAGKGTQAHDLQERFGLGLIATGDIFRMNVQNGTPLGVEAKSYMDAGELVPDDVVVRMVEEAIRHNDDGFILDGFPRTVAQALALEKELARSEKRLFAALAFDLDEEIAVRRLAGRRTCTQCQRTYNVEFKPPAVEGVCDVCGGELVQREDDREETVRHRIEVYNQGATALHRFYWERGLLRVVHADADEDEVTERAVAALKDRGPFED